MNIASHTVDHSTATGAAARARCQACGIGELRYARRLAWWERVLVDATPFRVVRCRACHHRGWRFGRLPPKP